tara:strand:- start:1490 stop:3163 length:1674 start_codon:yes stop_codon:yes gene_type:complete
MAIGDATVNMVDMNIVDRRLKSIAEEMGIVLMKTSYSTIFNEGRDFTCGVADDSCELVASADFQPAQVGGMPLVVASIMKEIPLSEMDEGDVIIHNDPFRGGMHTPEHTLVKPIFFEGEFFGFSVAIGHIAEVGGMVPGGFPGEATEVYQEGLRVPPVKIQAKGEDVQPVWKIMLSNHRTPRQNHGDIRALISAVNRGESRIIELINEYGSNRYREICKDLKDYAERRMRAEIISIPDGIYSFEDYMEDDGVTDQAYKIAVDVYVSDDKIVADFSRSDNQSLGPINAVLSVAWSATYNAILHLTDPQIPRNSGAFRPIKIVAPPGKLVNADFPAATVGGNTETHIRICHTVVGAIAQAIPDRAFAADGGTHSNFLFGTTDERTGNYAVCYDFTGAGWGGRPIADGHNATNCINGNSRMNPVEVFETRFPWRIETLGLISGSGGDGQYRGGLGVNKVLTCLSDDMEVSFMSDRQKISPWGIRGGGAGQNGSVLIKRKSSTDFVSACEDSNKTSASKFNRIRFRKGDQISISSPGGGGYGNPKDRSAKRRARDQDEGWI